MKTRILYTKGYGQFSEDEWEVPPGSDRGILVKSIMTGVCRSDIDMMQGGFGPLPIHMSGHEGLGQVISVGNEITDVQIGDFVATRGEPAYADVYPVRQHEYVVVPEASPKYILEPVACGVNCVMQAREEIAKRQGNGKRLLLMGSGFLAWVVYHTLQYFKMNFEITVVGRSNRDMWGGVLQQDFRGTFDVVIDLSSENMFDKDIYNNSALLVAGVQKPTTTDFAHLLWKACTVIFPSPRTDNFHHSMLLAKHLIESGKLTVDQFWSRGYNRNTEWKKAFSDATNRDRSYSRGYIYWPDNV